MKSEYPILNKFSSDHYWDSDEEEGRVMDYTISEDGKTIEFEEACDNYYTLTLTKQELFQLAEELKQLANTLKD